MNDFEISSTQLPGDADGEFGSSARPKTLLARSAELIHLWVCSHFVLAPAEKKAARWGNRN